MRTLIKRTIASTMAALLLALTVVETLPAQRAGSGAPAQQVTRSVARPGIATLATASTAIVAPAPGDLTATGWREQLACAGCVGALLVATGTGSIAALLMVIGANPEAAVGCTVGCVIAFS